MACIDSESLITGSNDSIVRLWKVARKDGRPYLSQTHILRAHEDSVICVTACRAWSVAVSGSKDGTAIIWDLNRAVYVRSIYHKPQSGKEKEVDDYNVHLVAINESTVRTLLSLFFILPLWILTCLLLFCSMDRALLPHVRQRNFVYTQLTLIQSQY